MLKRFLIVFFIFVSNYFFYSEAKTRRCTILKTVFKNGNVVYEKTQYLDKGFAKMLLWAKYNTVWYTSVDEDGNNLCDSKSSEIFKDLEEKFNSLPQSYIHPGPDFATTSMVAFEEEYQLKRRKLR